MPDITMCGGKDCHLKDSCYRYKAKPSPFMQSYFTTPPINLETKKCNYYWKETKTTEFTI